MKTKFDYPRENLLEAQEKLHDVLDILRTEAANRPKSTGSGVRELSIAITQIELGCMAMNRSLFAKNPYSPLMPYLKESSHDGPSDASSNEPIG